MGRSGESWEWQLASLGRGYGPVRLPRNRAQFRAHQISYAMTTGTDPGPMLVCHSCDNPKCVRPAHLHSLEPRKQIQRAKEQPHRIEDGVYGM
ncbi:HNH endonuclease [Puniceibacterium sp. IMCC21224]|uniref:HNH endonuclease n=1 Tax=Puniceibacterium sp. IMCC21224 TaxID=1618204 RepID=UPI0035104E44